MSRKSTFAKMIAAAAVTGMFAGSSARVHATPASSHMTLSASLAGSAVAMADTKHDCKGKNDCKGQGGCKASDNGCKGKNSCKGKGGCSTNTATPTPTPKAK